MPGTERPEEALPAQGQPGAGRHGGGPRRTGLARNRHNQPGRRGGPGGGHSDDRQRITGLDAGLDPAARRLDVVEDGPPGQGHDPHGHAGRAEKVELGGTRGDPVGTDQGRSPQAEPSAREARVSDAPAETPTARIIRSNVAADIADMDDIELAALGVS